MADGDPYTAFSVQLPDGEDPFIRADPSSIVNQIGSQRSRWVDPNIDLASTIKDIRFGKSLWRIFLLLALGALILEMVIAKTDPDSFRETGP